MTRTAGSGLLKKAAIRAAGEFHAFDLAHFLGIKRRNFIAKKGLLVFVFYIMISKSFFHCFRRSIHSMTTLVRELNMLARDLRAIYIKNTPKLGNGQPNQQLKDASILAAAGRISVVADIIISDVGQEEILGRFSEAQLALINLAEILSQTQRTDLAGICSRFDQFQNAYICRPIPDATVTGDAETITFPKAQELDAASEVTQPNIIVLPGKREGITRQDYREQMDQVLKEATIGKFDPRNSGALVCVNGVLMPARDYVNTVDSRFGCRSYAQSEPTQ